MPISALLPLFLGGLGIRESLNQSKLDEQRAFNASQRGLLGQGVQDALGQAPGIFDAPLFPGEAPIPGLETAGSGLLADPNNQANQLQFGANMFGLPGGAGAGQSLIQQALGFGQADQKQDNQFEFNANQNLLDRTQRDDHAAARIFENRRIANLKTAGLGDPSLGSIAAGHQRVQLPSGQFTDVPLPNTPRWTAASEQIQLNEKGVNLIGDLLAEVTGENGFEKFGRGAGRQRVLYEGLVAQAQAMFDKGALQGEERAEIENALINPTDITPFTSDAEIIEGYKTAQRILQNALKQKNQLYQAWGLGSQLANTTPAQLKQLEQRRQLEQSAAAQGLTLTNQPQPEPV